MPTKSTKNKPNIEVASLTESSFPDLIGKKYQKAKIVLLVDENTHDYCLEYLLTQFTELQEAEVMLLPKGEENKVLEICFQVWEALSEYKVTRHDLIINLGGGLVTDMGGFIASIYKRGISFIHIPTSLLAMVDAAIGGKTGVDLGRFKNQLGVFAEPEAIYIDTAFLSTLPQNEIANGYAEMLKHALISDLKYWKELTKAQLNINESLIKTSISIKTKIVQADPYEKGERKKLNFGHTFGHAIEGLLLHSENQIQHGHAVAIGILCEAYISQKRKLLSSIAFEEIVKSIVTLYPIPKLNDQQFDALFELMQQDKKNKGGKILCVLLDAIGSCKIDQEIDKKEIDESLYWLISLNK